MSRTAVGVIVAFAIGVVGLAAQTPAPSTTDPLYTAIRGGDTSQLRALLEAGANVNAHDRRGGATPLMQAAAVGSLDTVRLLIDKGADVNARSAANATALMWAVTDIAKVRLLLEHGADVNAASDAGRTPLILAALSDQSSEIVALLLAKGANPRAVDATNVTTLWAAAMGGDADTVRQLIGSGAPIDAADTVTASTPLMNAVGSGSLEIVRLLLAKGANVNAVSGPPSQPVKNGIINMGRFTPLTLAAPGPASIVKALLDAGANARVTEVRGMTPLMLSTATDHGDPETVRLLIPRSDLAAKSLAGETALDWAIKSGATPIVAMLKAAQAPLSASATDTPAAIGAPAPVSQRAAVERSVALIERASGTFFANGACGACHSQNITDFATMSARRHGVRISDEAATGRATGAAAAFAATATRLLERQDPPAVDISLYALAAFAAANYPPDRATDALLVNVVAQQKREGNWHIGGIPRPPIEDGDVSRTALGVRALSVYAPPGRADDMHRRTAKAMAWLQSANAITTEDRTFRLLGLLWGGADRAIVQQAAADLLRTQRSDGGWSQRPEMTSDAYATGTALYALLEARAATARDITTSRAVTYLLSTQRADGSWFVQSRSLKFQPYFDGGFPYGHNQWISSMASGWATAALALALDDVAARTAGAN